MYDEPTIKTLGIKQKKKSTTKRLSCLMNNCKEDLRCNVKHQASAFAVHQETVQTTAVAGTQGIL